MEWVSTILAMDGDLSLFGDDEPAKPRPAAPAPSPIADWQGDLLRKALDGRGLHGMEERQRLVEEYAGRPVASLRVLTHEEAIKVLSQLGRSAPPRTSGSAWEERDEDTWIDRL